MILTSKQIKERLFEHWPKLPHVWLLSKQYYVPTSAEIKQIVSESDVRGILYRRGLMECENYAWFLHSDVKRWGVRNNFEAPIAFGFALGTRIESSRDPVHAVNFCVTREGVYLIEPQTYQIISPVKGIRSKDKNFLFKVEM